MSQKRSNRTLNQTVAFDPSLEGAVNECVRFLFYREGSKIPIKRAEIIKHLSTVCQTTTGQVNAVIVEANNILKRVYGYKLVQVEAKSGISYIIVLNEECESLPSAITDVNQRRMLIAALTHCYMTGAPVKEEDMWKFLCEAGLLDEDDYTSRKIFTTTFVRQMYLQYSKTGEGDLSRNVFEWGQRAQEEIPKLFLLKKMAEAFEKTPEHWCEQYNEALRENTNE